ncbi:MAG: hypothetical protein M1530_03560 [Candidatus Marsarchaeota archaeon]|nr:hypothetical protein [Candidatus Marsarchaeota archaeon]
MNHAFSLTLASILLLALAAGAHAALPAEVAGYLEQDMNISTQPLLGASDAQLLSLDGKESFAVQSGRLLTDAEDIRPLLEKDLLSRAGFDDALNASREALADLQSVRASPQASCNHLPCEAYCAQLTAVDRFPCFDKASCVKTAMANPQTTTMINAEGFWEAMVGWQASRLNFNESLNALDAALQSPSPSADYARSVQADLAAARTQFDQFMHNNLYRTRYDADCTTFNRSTCFEYCTRTNWSGKSNWSALETRWGQMASSLDSLGSQSGRAQSLASSTSDWLNYTKNRQSLWSAMSKELEQKRVSLATRFASSNSSWSDPMLASGIMLWKQQLNDTQALAAGGRIRSALARQTDLDTQASALMATLSDHDSRASHINNSFTSIRLGLSYLSKAGSNQSAALSASFSSLQASAKAPIPADQLAGLENQSSQLEQLVLSEVARAQLNLPPSSQNVSAQAQAITGGNENKSTNASANASAPPASSLSKFNPLPCALPIIGMALLLGMAFISRR